MNKILTPCIKGISLRNYQIVEDGIFNIHVKGDIYYEDKCIGYYNPAYQPSRNSPPEVFIRLEQENQEFWDKFRYHYSIFDYADFGQKIVDDVAVYPHGFTVLLSDLEFLIRLYDFMNDIVRKTGDENRDFDTCNLIGIINNNTISPIQFKKDIDMDRDSLVQFIKEKIPQITIDENYPIRIFRRRSDFIFNSVAVLAENNI